MSYRKIVSMKDKANEQQKKEQEIKRKKFWHELIKRAKLKNKEFIKFEIGNAQNLQKSTDLLGVYYQFFISPIQARVEVLIDTKDMKKNDEIYDKLLKNKDEIERKFGQNLSWERPENAFVRRITKRIREMGLENEENWEKLQNLMIDLMLKLEKSIDKFIK